MSRDDYAAYLASPEWRAKRAQAIRRDGYRCRGCNTPHDLEAHHRRYPDRLGTESVDDLTTLCAACHRTLTVSIRARGGLFPSEPQHSFADGLEWWGARDPVAWVRRLWAAATASARS